MTSLEPVYAGWAVPWCRRLRATTASTALLFTLMNLVPGGTMLGGLIEQAVGIPFWSTAIWVLLLIASVSALLYLCSLVILQKLSQRQLDKPRGDPKANARTYLYLRSFDQNKSSIADQAELIFVTPALTEGSKWELIKLFENNELLQKTIFVMPRNWYSDEWDDLRRAFSSLFALELPEYDAKGGYFVANHGDCAPRAVEPQAFIESLRRQPTRELISGGSLHFAEI